MILRRVIEHVRTQNWTAVVVDFVIVVSGVFIGIQVANWNAARADQVRGRSYLERLHTDLQTDIRNYNLKIDFWDRVAAFCDQALAYADSNDSGDATDWQLVLAFFQASQVEEFSTTQPTYDELRSAGELGLIRNIDLRKEISSYYANAGNAALDVFPVYREHVRGVIPTDVQVYIWNECYQSLPNEGQRMFACASPVDDARASSILASIVSRSEIMEELRYWRSTLTVSKFISRDRILFAQAIIDLIEAEPGLELQDQ